MPLTVQEFDRIIGKLQMTARQGKHKFVWLEHAGKKILWTERSQGRGDVGRVEHAIRKQLRVNHSQLRDLANCPMTRDAYITHLKSIGAIEEDKQ
jgi:hypothetical protein